jgi:hypothetical protein
MITVGKTLELQGQGREPVHSHPLLVHTHDHYHVAHVHASGMTPDFTHQACWHAHEHDHNQVTHSHDYSRLNEDEHHDRRGHIHDHAAPVQAAM